MLSTISWFFLVFFYLGFLFLCGALFCRLSLSFFLVRDVVDMVEIEVDSDPCHEH